MTFNWRKPLILAGLYLTGSNIPKYLKEIERVSQLPQKEIKTYQEEKLQKLLLYAYHNVPYYHRILPEAGVISDEDVRLENFQKIPILTKEIIRNEGANLYSKDYQKRNFFLNTSGGSTGEPVQFIQDKEFDDWNTATKLFFFKNLGKDLGEKEIKFWGSERDILSGSIGLKNKLVNYVYNRQFSNSFCIDNSKLLALSSLSNSFKPRIIWSYMESAYELARYAEKNKLTVFCPKGIVVTAGVLSEEMRDYIQKSLMTKVYNQYGSREVGVIACECTAQNGLHIFQTSQLLESINVGNMPESRLIITNLTNYSMPLIRYEIGDTGEINIDPCSCKLGFELLKNVTGRISDHFKRLDGSIIYGEYFTHIFYFKKWVKKFQVIQVNYNEIICKLVILQNEDITNDLEDIKNNIQAVMGNECNIKFEFVESIEPSKSGKFQYTICELNNARV